MNLHSRIQNYIDGQHLDSLSGEFFDNIDPSTGKSYSTIPNSDAKDVELAYQAAKKAFPVWSRMEEKERAAWMIRLATAIEKNLESFAKAESVDNGKPISLARQMDIPRSVANLKFFASAILHWNSEAHITDHQALNYTLRKPIGVVGCISPWNLPLYLFTWKIAPAMATGNCVVAKPSEITPMTAYLLTKTCEEIGFPAGVLNVVHGTGSLAGSALVEHPGIKAISFTGGTATGAHIARVAAPMFKKLSLELGGKNPNIIFADADLEKALKTTLRSSFANQGQICLCGSRILIHSSIYEEFKRQLVEKTQSMSVGDPLSEETKTGAVVSEAHMKKVLAYIELAQEEGGVVLCGGDRVKLEGRCADGYFIAPTIIEGLGPHCRTNQEEIFGPVVTLQSFESDEEAIELANATPYGLAASIWTKDLNRAHQLSSRMDSGIVWVNTWLMRDLRTPFGGVKNSGVGREGGWDALRFFTEAQNVCIAFDDMR
ncbi:MAG: aldehyde dehydrogenase [Flavobacteriales bacterium]